MTLGQNGVLRFGHFSDFLEYFKIGLYIKVDVNEGQNKFEVHI